MNKCTTDEKCLINTLAVHIDIFVISFFKIRNLQFAHFLDARQEMFIRWANNICIQLLWHCKLFNTLFKAPIICWPVKTKAESYYKNLLLFFCLRDVLNRHRLRRQHGTVCYSKYVYSKLFSLHPKRFNI